RVFRGPIPEQIVSVLNYLNSLGGTLLQKVSGQAEVEKTVAYPSGAIEEALVNAFYHRGYDGPAEPVKVYLYPDRMEVISYPGPVPGIQPSYFQTGDVLPPVPARNRRIGDFLKELRLAEKRGSGIPKIRRRMQQNGSPEARFDFDETRTYFRAILPVHPRYFVLHALREAGYLWATGEKKLALEHLERSLDREPDSAALARQIVEYAVGLGDQPRAERALERYRKAGGEPLDSVPPTVRAMNPDDSNLISDLAETKIELAQRLRPDEDPAAKARLYREAIDLLRRALQLSKDPERQARHWFGLARALDGLGASSEEIQAAFEKALTLTPAEATFRDAYESWLKKSSSEQPP